METDQEPLIPDSPRIVLPRIVVGVWFWIALAAFVASIVLAKVGEYQVWPYSLNVGAVGHVFTLDWMFHHRLASFAIATVRTFFGAGAVMLAALVLLWVTFARSTNADRVVFVPMATLTAWLLSQALQSMITGRYGFLAERVVSQPIVITLVGAVALTIAGRGLSARLRFIVSSLCAVAVAQELLVGVLVGQSLVLIATSVVLGLAVIATCLEVADVAGARPFAVDDSEGDVRTSLSRGGWGWLIVLGAAGTAAAILIGVAAVKKLIALPGGEFQQSGEIGVDYPDSSRFPALHVASHILGGIYTWEIVAVALVWLAFLRPKTISRAGFACAVIVATSLVASDISEVFLTLIPNGYPGMISALCVVGFAALSIVARGLVPRWRRVVDVLCVALGGFVLIDQLIAGEPPAYLVGGVLIGASVFAFGVAVARRRGIDLFALDEA